MSTKPHQSTDFLFTNSLSESVAALLGWIQIDVRIKLFTSKPDIFRQVPLRYLGYGFGVGEALRYRFQPGLSQPFYTVATGFVFAHCVYMMMEASDQYDDPVVIILVPKQERHVRVIVAFFDTLLWEYLASYLISSAIVFHVCSITDAFISIYASGNNRVQYFLPVILAIAVLPLIMVPVDKTVDIIMDQFIRPLYITPLGISIRY